MDDLIQTTKQQPTPTHTHTHQKKQTKTNKQTKNTSNNIKSNTAVIIIIMTYNGDENAHRNISDFQ